GRAARGHGGAGRADAPPVVPTDAGGRRTDAWGSLREWTGGALRPGAPRAAGAGPPAARPAGHPEMLKVVRRCSTARLLPTFCKGDVSPYRSAISGSLAVSAP